MQYREFLDELTLDDLQEQHRRLAEVIGLEALIKLSEYCGGTHLNIPMPFELAKGLIYRKINEEYDGKNIRCLAIKYKVSESTVYRLLGPLKEERKNKVYGEQTTLV